jgi:hypothetical protein
MRVILRYFEGDPNWETAEERIRETIATGAYGVVEVELERVSSSEQAAELKFRGSPTILVDGVDPFGSEETGYGLTCRAYRTENGMDGSPSTLQLAEAFAAAASAPPLPSD